MKFTFIATLALSALLFACKNDSGEGVREIREGSNAEIIRNPATADQPLDTNKLARMVFEEPEFNFGEVKEGEIVTHSFKFKNTGNVPLVINNARASCGCTVPTWPEDPIPPGGFGEITARFNTEHKPERQKKVIKVTANTYPNETSVALNGYVIPAKK